VVLARPLIYVLTRPGMLVVADDSHPGDPAGRRPTPARPGARKATRGDLSNR
jgi:hypothetical protein